MSVCRKCDKPDPKSNSNWVGCDENGRKIWFCSRECYWNYPEGANALPYWNAPCCGINHLLDRKRMDKSQEDV